MKVLSLNKITFIGTDFSIFWGDTVQPTTLHGAENKTSVTSSSWAVCSQVLKVEWDASSHGNLVLPCSFLLGSHASVKSLHLLHTCLVLLLNYYTRWGVGVPKHVKSKSVGLMDARAKICQSRIPESCLLPLLMLRWYKRWESFLKIFAASGIYSPPLCPKFADPMVVAILLYFYGIVNLFPGCSTSGFMSN